MPNSPQQLAATASSRGVREQIEVFGSATRYWRYPANKGSDYFFETPTLIMIHGFRGNHRGLEAIAGALPDFELIIPDLPGFGESSPLSEGHTVAAYAAWLSEFLRLLNLESKAHLLGHSFGSIVVSHAVAKGLPVKTLTLENPVSAPALKGPKVIATRVANGFYEATERMPLAAGERALKSWPMVRGMSILMAKTKNRELRAWIHRQHDENFNDFVSRRTVLEAFKASTSECVGQWVEQFAVPTLFIIGDKDDITSPKQQREAFSRLRVPGRLVEHDGVGHLTHYEIPHDVAQDIRLFIAGLETSPLVDTEEEQTNGS
jgi:pimeloyl-ACP methyl ester carboxylesterase